MWYPAIEVGENYSVGKVGTYLFSIASTRIISGTRNIKVNKFNTWVIKKFSCSNTIKLGEMLFFSLQLNLTHTISQS